VADSEGQEIRVFQKQGATFIPVLKLVPTANPSFYPLGITDDGAGKLYIVDSGENIVWKYPTDFSAPPAPITLSGISQARRISMDKFGNFYVTDNGAGYVVYDSAWNIAYSCNSANGSGFSQPQGIAVDLDGHIYLTDQYAMRALRMAPCPYFLSFITPTPVATPTPTPTYTPAPTSFGTPTPTYTYSITATPTPSPTWTTTFTPTPSRTPTMTPTLVGPDGIYPNPCTGGTTSLRISLDSPGDVTVQVWTVAARKVAEWSFGFLPPGVKDLPLVVEDKWGTPLGNGLYYLVVDKPGGKKLFKIIVLK